MVLLVGEAKGGTASTTEVMHMVEVQVEMHHPPVQVEMGETVQTPHHQVQVEMGDQPSQPQSKLFGKSTQGLS